jgi:hypothetical protein
MCQFFSSIITRDSRLLFTEKDSHEVIIERAGLRDDKPGLYADFVRLEATLDDHGNIVVNEDTDEAPAWLCENWLDIRERVQQLYERVAPPHGRYLEALFREEKRHWQRREREAGLVAWPHVAVTDGRRTPTDNAYQRGETLRRNAHPTVKPVRLTEYLARLILPPALPQPRRLLVPFAGSGSEMIGALLAGWDAIDGIEQSADYVAIAHARLAWWSQFENYEQAQCAYKKDKKRQTTEDEAIIEQLPLAGEWS